MIYIAGQICGQVRAAILVAEFWNFGYGWQGVARLHAHPATARLGEINPGVTIALLARIGVGVDATRVRVLTGQGRDDHALTRLRLETPPVILAGDSTAVEPSTGERDAAMGAA